MLRRDFLVRVAESASVVALGNNLMGATKGRSSGVRKADKRDRIAISTWSLHNYFSATRSKDFTLPGNMIALLDFPDLIATKYNIHNLEFCAPHFASTDKAYLLELKGRLAKAHSRLINIPVDIRELHMGGGLSDPDKSIRDAGVNAAKKWIDIAAVLHARAVRCDPGKMNPMDLAPTADSYKQLGAYGKTKGVQVIIENHGGVGSEHPEELVRLFKMANTNMVGALPDFGNFPDEATREKGLAALFPYTHVVSHAKGLEFDSTGQETKYNFPRCIEISKKAGFKGIYSIEYEGPGDPYEGVQKTLDELLKYL